jgi:hypothetical protein
MQWPKKADQSARRSPPDGTLAFPDRRPTIWQFRDLISEDRAAGDAE